MLGMELTAIGLASVLTKSEVIFSVRDIMGQVEEPRRCYKGQLNWHK